MNPSEEFLTLLFNDPLEKADAVVMLCGDGFNRLDATIEIYKKKWTDKIVISGGSDNLSYGSIPAPIIKQKFTDQGISSESIILEDKSQNTKDQAVNILELAKKEKWNTIILVASHYHQPRAFLTFIKQLKKSHSDLKIINYPARNLSWSEDNKWGKRIDLLKGEFEKIKEYGKLGDVSDFEEGVEYLKWRQSE